VPAFQKKHLIKHADGHFLSSCGERACDRRSSSSDFYSDASLACGPCLLGV
jgi:hypothetical protein